MVRWSALVGTDNASDKATNLFTEGDIRTTTDTIYYKAGGRKNCCLQIQNDQHNTTLIPRGRENDTSGPVESFSHLMSDFQVEVIQIHVKSVLDPISHEDEVVSNSRYDELEFL